jgi:hypothetical protein
MTMRSGRRELPRASRLLRAFACISAGLVAGVSLYVGFIEAGVIRNPFGPVLRGDLDLAHSNRTGMRVLFVGNSFTYYNSMPALVQRLAAADAGAEPIFAVWHTRPGWTLREASGDDGLEALLEDVRWDTVVLQEQSQLALERHREADPFVRDLQRRIASGGARTILYMTWWYRADWDLAAELSVPVAPVAPAWAEAERRDPGLNLWASDGRHPGPAGSYLAACVFYATLTGRDPSASSFTAGLRQGEARFLQQVASDVVDRGW